jgi:N-formylmaleamate deformylase
MTSWQSGTVEANGIRLHYYRTGAGATPGTLWVGHSAKPPVVLAHGVTDDGLCWTPVAEALAPEYDVMMVDARGHGRSEAPEQGYDPATQAADLAGVITALGLQRPAVLGHSMGAVTTLVLAGTHPDVPRAILLEDPPGWWMVTPDASPVDAAKQAGTRASAVIHGRTLTGEERQMGMQAWLTELKRKTREELIAEQRAATPSWSEAELGPWADAKLRLSLNVLDVFNPNTPRTVDWPATLRRITCPALLITADPDRGAILTEDGAAALRARVPQLRIAHISRAGHNIRRDQFARYMDVVRTFLAEHTRAAR